MKIFDLFLEPDVGVKIPREIVPPPRRGQAAGGYLHPRGTSCPGGKINRYTGIPKDNMHKRLEDSTCHVTPKQ